MQHEVFSRSSQLTSFEPFKWFLTECLEAKIAEAREAACDPGKSDEECKIARHVLRALEEVKKWPGARLQSSREYIDARAAQS